MNMDCEVVMDLLPLYVEKMCSHTSEERIKAHIANLPSLL